MVASKELDVSVFASIALIQYSLNIILRLGSVGINYEILRYGNKEKYEDSEYHVNLNRVLFGCTIILLIGTCAVFLVDGLYISFASLLIVPIGISIYLTSIAASVLRSIGGYIMSNILDKALVLSIAIIYLITIYNDSHISDVFPVLFLMSIIALAISLTLLSKRINLKKVFKFKRLFIDGNISNQMFLADIMFLTATSVDKLFINQSLSLEQLGIWIVYYQLFVPFQFAGRLLYQVFFPEMSHDRFKLTIKKGLIFIIAVIVGCIVLYFPIEYAYKSYYESTFEISSMAVALMIAMGGIYVLGVPSGLYLAAKLKSKNIFYNNVASAVLSVMLIITYSFLAPLSFPYLMILSICAYWFFKILATLLIIFYDKRSNYN